jgi:hypothetical protein
MNTRIAFAIPAALACILLAHGARAQSSRLSRADIYPDPARTPGADGATWASSEDIVGVVLRVLRRGSFPPAVAERSPARGKGGGDCPQNPLGGLAETVDS